MIQMCLDDDCTYQVSSPYEVFNLLAVADMSEEYTSRFMGGMPRKPPSPRLKNKKISTIDA